jgi:hypothetical protein
MKVQDESFVVGAGIRTHAALARTEPITLNAEDRKYAEAHLVKR